MRETLLGRSAKDPKSLLAPSLKHFWAFWVFGHFCTRPAVPGKPGCAEKAFLHEVSHNLRPSFRYHEDNAGKKKAYTRNLSLQKKGGPQKDSVVDMVFLGFI